MMPQYPLSESMPDQLKAASGRVYTDVTLDAVADGDLSANDLAVDATRCGHRRPSPRRPDSPSWRPICVAPPS
jgi:hypothetical protein